MRKSGSENIHERRNPKLTVNEEANLAGTGDKSNDDSRHQVSNNNQIADCDAEALDGNGSVEDDGEVRVGELGKRREGHMTAINVSCAPGLEV